jgi:hypothetical protein
MRRAAPPSRSLPPIGRSRSTSALQWLPPARLQDVDASGADEMIAASWMQSFVEKNQFTSPITVRRQKRTHAPCRKYKSSPAALYSRLMVFFGLFFVRQFIEFQLRQALAATSTARGPDAFRTACVCECLHRLAQPDAAGAGCAAVLSLMREELLKAIYVDYKPFGRGTHVSSRPVLTRRTRAPVGLFSSALLWGLRRARRTDTSPSVPFLLRQPVDAQALLSRRTHFSDCDTLRKRVSALEERLADLEAAREALAQDTDGRNELLRLAASRWSAVLAGLQESPRGGARGSEALQETIRKLNGLLDSMHQHSKSLDELQRISLLEPEERLHTQLASLSNGARRQFLLALITKQGSQLLMQQEEGVAVIQSMLSGLNAVERRSLLRALIAHEGVASSAQEVVSDLVGDLSTTALAALLTSQLSHYVARMAVSPADAPRFLREFVDSAVLRATTTTHARASQTDAATQGADVGIQTETPFGGQGARAELLAEIAAEVGPEATAALPSALEAMVAREREQRLLESPSRGTPSSRRGPATPLPAGSGSPPDEQAAHRTLLPLLLALEKRCSKLRETEVALRAEVARVRAAGGGGCVEPRRKDDGGMS